ncbi:hypothetical protein CXY01_18460 [Cellulomonas xylanilytica]|uniref:Uncharacterized protein n=1 Tax=Cellulomonas xylanilytica TaxID=233583 RepID=A0A510V3D6_9CELL|nr:hypothetical protein CXY01_18460 [Cellulomonas xylanilytica]
MADASVGLDATLAVATDVGAAATAAARATTRLSTEVVPAGWNPVPATALAPEPTVTVAVRARTATRAARDAGRFTDRRWPFVAWRTVSRSAVVGINTYNSPRERIA